MKVLQIGPIPQHLGSKNRGGIAHHVWTLSKRLSQSGQNVSILAVGRYFKMPQQKESIFIYGPKINISAFFKTVLMFPLLISKIGTSPIFKTYFHALYSLYRLQLIKDLDGFDIIHMHGLHNSALYALNLLGVESAKIVTVHSYTGIISENKERSFRRINFINSYLKYAQCVIHVSNSDKEKGFRHGFSFNKTEKVIHNGVEENVEQSFGCKPHLCFVGYLNANKRISLLLKSSDFIRSDIQQINIVGEGELKRKVELAADNNRLINYHGVLPNDEVREIMRTSSVLVVPSLSESFGIVYIEALFEGTAVIGYAPTIEEFQNVMDLSELERKLVVPVPAEEIQPEKLAKIIDSTYEFRQSSEGIQAMERVRQKAIEAFGWDAVIDKMTTLYEDIIDSNLNSRA